MRGGWPAAWLMRHVLAEHSLLRVGKLGPWPNAELVVEPAAQVVEQGKRSGLLSAAGQGEHQRRVCPLVQRLGRREFPQPGQDVVGPSGRRGRRRVPDDEVRSALAQGHHDRVRVQDLEVGERIGPPGTECASVGLAGLAKLSGRVSQRRTTRMGIERHQVELVAGRRQLVAGACRGPKAIRTEHAAQPVDVDLDQMHSGRG